MGGGDDLMMSEWRHAGNGIVGSLHKALLLIHLKETGVINGSIEKEDRTRIMSSSAIRVGKAPSNRYSATGSGTLVT